MPKRNTKIVSMRVSVALYDLLASVTRELNKLANTKNVSDRLSVGDTARMMVQYFVMMYTLGQWSKPLNEVRKQFVEFLEEKPTLNSQDEQYRNHSEKKEG